MSNNESKPALDPAFIARARDAYATYIAASGGLNFRGEPCPEWDDLPEQIRANWYTVALRFREHEVMATRPGDEVMHPPLPRVFAHLPAPARALALWQRYMGVAELRPAPAAILADEMRRGVARFVSAEQQLAPADPPAEDAMLRRIKEPWEAYQADLAKVGAPAAASSATAPVSAEPPVGSTRAAWVSALRIGGGTTPAQQRRNFALYQRLKDGEGTGDFRTSGLAGFVYDVPIERMRIAPDGSSFSFRLDRNDECLRRLLSVVVDHLDTRCDADDEVERLRARVAELEARQGGAP